MVEDNPGDVRLLEELLTEGKATRFDLQVAPRLKQALDLLSAHSFDACFLDMGLPDSEGLNGLKQIQAAAPDLPVIIRTSLDDKELAVAAVQSGAQDYVVKGLIEGDQLSRIMRYAIERKKVENETVELSRQLVRERDTLEIMMENSPDVNLVYLDPDFNFVIVNSAYAESCRMSKEDLIGKNHFDLFPHDENEAIFKQVRDTGEPVRYEEKRFEFPGQPERGATYWDWTLTPSKDSDGMVQGLVFSLVDVTEKVLARRYDEALKQVNAAIGATLDMNEVLERAVIAIPSFQEIETVLVAIIEDDNWVIRISSREDKYAADTSIPRSSARPLEDMLSKCETIVIEDLSKEDKPVRRLGKEFGSKSLMAAALMEKDKLVGALAFPYQEGKEFSPAQIDFVTNLAATVSRALDNARLYREEQQTRATIQGYAAQLSVLHEIGISLNTETDSSKLLRKITKSAADLTSAGFSILIQEKADAIGVGGLYYQDPWQREDFTSVDGRTSELYQELLKTIPDRDQYAFRTPVGEEQTLLNELFPEAPELLVGVLRDTRRRVKGLFLMGGHKGRGGFSGSDEEVFSLLAAQSSVALISAENFEKEHYVAEVLQSSLLPEVPLNSSFDLGLLYRSASQLGRIGGDFYDFVELGEDAIAVAVGDVCGKGLVAANYTAMVKYMLRAYLEEDPDPGLCMTRLNKAISKNLSPEKFITMCLAIIRAKDGVIVYAIAGHPAPLVKRGNQIVHMEAADTLPLGVLPDYKYASASTDILGSTAILMFTDGLIESRSPGGEQFGYKRLETAFASRVCLPAQRLAQSLLDRVLEFTEDTLSDDMAIVAIKSAVIAAAGISTSLGAGNRELPSIG